MFSNLKYCVDIYYFICVPRVIIYVNSQNDHVLLRIWNRAQTFAFWKWTLINDHLHLFKMNQDLVSNSWIHNLEGCKFFYNILVGRTRTGDFYPMVWSIMMPQRYLASWNFEHALKAYSFLCVIFTWSQILGIGCELGHRSTNKLGIYSCYLRQKMYL